MTNNQGIDHYAPGRRVYCGRRDAIMGVAEIWQFLTARKPCKRCMGKLQRAIQLQALRAVKSWYRA
jgi:hypothetical protein